MKIHFLFYWRLLWLLPIFTTEVVLVVLVWMIVKDLFISMFTVLLFVFVFVGWLGISVGFARGWLCSWVLFLSRGCHTEACNSLQQSCIRTEPLKHDIHQFIVCFENAWKLV